MSVKNIRKLISVGLVIVLALVFGLTTKSFFSARNISMLFHDAAYVGLITLGVSFVLIGGGIDLSVGGIVCFTGMICARLGTVKGFPMICIVLIAVVAGALCGLINGLCITKLHLSEFITTLSTGYIFSGFAVAIVYRVNGVVTSVPITNKPFLKLGAAFNRYYYPIVIAWVVLAVIVLFVQTRTKYGRHTVACGSDPKAARMSGINTDFMKVSGFVLCGAFAALAAVFTVSYQTTAQLTLGGSVGFEAVAACVVGGIVMGGGRGDAVAAFLGSLFMAMLVNGINKYGLSIAWQYLSQGLFILLAIFFDAKFGQFFEERRRIAVEKARLAAKERFAAKKQSGGIKDGE